MAHLMPLGDQAVLAYLPDEAAALRFAAAVRAAAFPWLIDVVQAYTSVAVFYDLDRIGYAGAAAALRPLLDDDRSLTSESRLHVIPCCYVMNLDLERVAARCGLTPDDVIRRHSGTEYTVYAIGFCPGFPYLGYLPAEL